LFANADKCTFYVDSVTFLGFIVNNKGVHVDPTKIKVNQDWPTQKNVGDIRSFQGLGNFYIQFVLNFSSLVSPFNELVKKDLHSIGEKNNKKTFQRIKFLFTNASSLALLDFSKPFELECDASGVGICVVLLQSVHRIAYFSKKLHGAINEYIFFQTYKVFNLDFLRL